MLWNPSVEVTHIFLYIFFFVQPLGLMVTLLTTNQQVLSSAVGFFSGKYFHGIYALGAFVINFLFSVVLSGGPWTLLTAGHSGPFNCTCFCMWSTVIYTLVSLQIYFFITEGLKKYNFIFVY